MNVSEITYLRITEWNYKSVAELEIRDAEEERRDGQADGQRIEISPGLNSDLDRDPSARSHYVDLCGIALKCCVITARALSLSLSLSFSNRERGSNQGIPVAIADGGRIRSVTPVADEQIYDEVEDPSVPG